MSENAIQLIQPPLVSVSSKPAYDVPVEVKEPPPVENGGSAGTSPPLPVPAELLGFNFYA